MEHSQWPDLVLIGKATAQKSTLMSRFIKPGRKGGATRWPSFDARAGFGMRWKSSQWHFVEQEMDDAEHEGQHPAIRRPWSSEEDEDLTRLVGQLGTSSWNFISAGIPDRNPRACRHRWLKHLQPDVERRPFTADEDETIIAAHAKYGNRWAAIARLLPARTNVAVVYRWYTTLAREWWTELSDAAAGEPTTSLRIDLQGYEEVPVAGGGGDQRENERRDRIIRRPWSSEEDEELTRLVGQHGTNSWNVVSAGIPGRSNSSCRVRWLKCLSPDVEHRPFTADEDKIIIAAHAKYGNKWTAIARLLPGRTDAKVKNRWSTTLAWNRTEFDATGSKPTTSLPIRLPRDEEPPVAGSRGGDKRGNEEMEAYLMSRRR